MTASSVTGLFNDGVGSVDGSNHGSERMTLHSSQLLGPRVVSAGTVTLASGVATVTFPQPLDGSETNYVVMLTAEADDAPSVSAKNDNSDSNFYSFSITDGSGSNSSDVMWAVIYIG